MWQCLAPDPKNKTRNARMLRSDQYKYNLFSYGSNNEQLFDIENDPGETKNLAFDPQMKNIVKQHKQKLNEWLIITNDDFKVS